jgi:ADP-heptose:LPS heptosyltransferase
VDCIVTDGDTIPDFAVQCPILSLPLPLKMTAATIPAPIPYLKADAAAVAHWRQRLADLPQRLKVGINWKGNAGFKNDRRRSTALANFAPLAEAASAHDIALISLHKGKVALSQADVPAGMHLIDYTADLADFADTAALIENLDLVISTDTSVPHLAGALGKEVWLLISASADWRWLIGRQDSPWYPTMRIFRQRTLGDWTEPIAAAAVELATFAQSHKGGRNS